MKTYEQAFFDVHNELMMHISQKMSYKEVEYIEGMLEAAQIVLDMMADELKKKEGK